MSEEVSRNSDLVESGVDEYNQPVIAKAKKEEPKVEEKTK